MRILRWFVIIAYFTIAAMPLAWMAVTSLKHKDDAIVPNARIVPILTGETPGSETDAASVCFPATTEAYRKLGEPFAGTTHSFFHYLVNSLIIGLLSTLAAVALGTACAYGFSRFRIAGSGDWLFFILSTRFLPPLAVVAPVLMMYRELGLQNTHLGLIILYTAFNLSLAVWLMKGFIDDIPRAYEEAALVDGYSRLHVFWKIVVPHAATGMAVTAVFCLISALNEYGFAMSLNNADAVTVPVYFAGLQGNIQGVPWPQVAAGALLFVVPVAAFTVIVRKHLLRGVTFGTIKQ
jgi:multiple sugar transport system permease protein